MVYIGTIAVAANNCENNLTTSNNCENNLTTSTPFDLFATEVLLESSEGFQPGGVRVALKHGVADAGFLPSGSEVGVPIIASGLGDGFGTEGPPVVRLNLGGGGTLAIRTAGSAADVKVFRLF